MLPMTFKLEMTKSDYRWHFLYYCLRHLRQRGLTAAILGLAITFFMQDYFSSWPALLAFFCAYSLGIWILTYFVDYPIYYMRMRKIKKKFPRSDAEITFFAEEFSLKNALSEGMQKYESLRKLHIHKRLIVLEQVFNLSYIIPWRDIPENRKEELMIFLIEVKARWNI